MKTKVIIIILIANILAAIDTFATTPMATTKKSKSVITKLSNSNPNSKLSTDIKFDGQVVGGKTQSPFESMAVIENEKNIDDLIGVRTSFSDRSKKAQGMR